jgi:hypothetical protein
MAVEVLCGFLLKTGILREFLKFLKKKRYKKRSWCTMCVAGSEIFEKCRLRQNLAWLAFCEFCQKKEENG